MEEKKNFEEFSKNDSKKAIPKSIALYDYDQNGLGQLKELAMLGSEDNAKNFCLQSFKLYKLQKNSLAFEEKKNLLQDILNIAKNICSSLPYGFYPTIEKELKVVLEGNKKTHYSQASHNNQSLYSNSNSVKTYGSVNDEAKDKKKSEGGCSIQ